MYIYVYKYWKTMKVDLLVDCDQKSLNAILPEGKKRKKKKKKKKTELKKRGKKFTLRYL